MFHSFGHTLGRTMISAREPRVFMSGPRTYPDRTLVGGSSYNWISLSGMIIVPDESNAVPLELANGWQNYGSIYGSATYASRQQVRKRKPPGTHTLMDMRTELTAVPHASLSEKPRETGFRSPNSKWSNLQRSRFQNAGPRNDRATRTTVRACLPSSLALYWKLESKLVNTTTKQVRRSDQLRYPPNS